MKAERRSVRSFAAFFAGVLALLIAGVVGAQQHHNPSALPSAQPPPIASVTAVASALPAASASAAGSASAPPAQASAARSQAAPDQQDMHNRQMPIPKDGATRDPELPPGTLEVYIRDAFEAPVADFSFELLIVHMTIAQGETRETMNGVTDAEGKAVFNDLKVGSGHAYTIRASYKGASYSVKDVRLGDREGAAALLHVFEPTGDIGMARAVGAAEVHITHKTGVLVLNYGILFEIPAPYALLIDLPLQLPEGHKAFTAPDNQYPNVVATPDGASIKGTLRPGRHVLQFTFHMPLEDDGDQAMTLPLPPRMVQATVKITASKKMGLDVSGFPPPKREYDGMASWLEATRELEPPIQSFIPESVEVKITGLPVRPWGSYLAVVMAALALVVGIAYALSRRTDKTAPADTVEDLIEAQQALLNEFLALEKARARGDVGPKTYARIRQAMLDALARILDRLEKVRGSLPARRVEALHPQEVTHAQKVRPARKKPSAARPR